MLNERIKFRSRINLEEPKSFDAIINRFVKLEPNIPSEHKCYFYFAIIDEEDTLIISTIPQNDICSYLIFQGAKYIFADASEDENAFTVKMLIEKCKLIKPNICTPFSVNDLLAFDKAMAGLSINTKPKE